MAARGKEGARCGSRIDPLSSRRFRFPDIPDRFIVGGFAIIPIAYFALMVVGMYRWYTPVPFWDMWDSYLMGYIDYLDGKWRSLFAQTNEHRIWFSNILFFLDLALFNGRSLLLVPFNALLVGGIWLVLALAARRLLKDKGDLWLLVSLASGPFCFSWLQEANLSWGFQSQFFFAYFFPLAAFCSLALSYTSQRRVLWFSTALGLGIASVGTMANGLAALPLLALMTLLMPSPSWKRGVIIVLAAAITMAVWFSGYVFIERETADISQFFSFVLTFFGMPAVAILEYRAESYIAAAVSYIRVGFIAGALFILAAVAYAVRWWFRRKLAEPMELALIVFLIYIGASCAVTAVGRATLEPNAALVSRYATPSLIGWAVLMLLSIYAFKNQRCVRPAVIIGGIILAIGMMPAQRAVFSDLGPETVHQKLVGALALKMRVQDMESIGRMYPTNTAYFVEHIRIVADMAEQKHLSIMGDAKLGRATSRLGTPVSEGFYPCLGNVDIRQEIPNEPNYLRVVGWAFDGRTNSVPSFAYLVVGDRIEGVVATGFVRRDVSAAVGRRALKSGFTGFARPAISSGAIVEIVCSS
ncbi:MAG: hypothetical protein AB7H70_17455 [Rhodospirillaceae bacterium]